MLMNKIEILSMNNPIRAWIQEHIELSRLKKYLPASLRDQSVLEIGCGNGNGAKLIKKHFNPKKITAVDLDERMISIAKKNNKSATTFFEVGDAANLRYKNDTFDAIFDFAIIHHIPNWKECLRELHRVLKKGGLVIIGDLSIETFNNGIGKSWKIILDHPYEEMYDRESFFAELERLGFEIKTKKIYNSLSVQHFIVIARK